MKYYAIAQLSDQVMAISTILEFTVRTGWHNICSGLEMDETDFKIAL